MKKGTQNLLIIGGVVVLGGLFLYQFLKGGGAGGGGGGIRTFFEEICERDEPSIVAPTGITYPQIGYPKPPIYPATTYTKSPVEVGNVFVEEAMSQAAATGIPTYIQKGGYYITAEGKWIKGVGW